MPNILKKLLMYLPKKLNLNNKKRQHWGNYCASIRKKYPIVLEEFKNKKKQLTHMCLLKNYQKF